MVFGELRGGVSAKSIHFFHIEGKKTVLGWLSWLRAVLLFFGELVAAM